MSIQTNCHDASIYGKPDVLVASPPVLFNTCAASTGALLFPVFGVPAPEGRLRAACRCCPRQRSSSSVARPPQVNDLRMQDEVKDARKEEVLCPADSSSRATGMQTG